MQRMVPEFVSEFNLAATATTTTTTPTENALEAYIQSFEKYTGERDEVDGLLKQSSGDESAIEKLKTLAAEKDSVLATYALAVLYSNGGLFLLFLILTVLAHDCSAL